MDLNGKKILVTGADGFIGSHLTETLVARGYDVRAFIYYNSFNSWGWLDHSPKSIKDSLEVFPGDIRDAHQVRKACQDVNVIFHLAALIAIPYSYQAAESYVETNVRGTLNLLEAAKEQKIHKFVQTSTSEVYGTARFVPITEQHPLQAQSPYAASKIASDQLALSYQASFGIPVAIARPFNTYGPRQSARAVIPTIITQIASGEKSIKLGSLHPTRDFNYVKDTVSGFIAIAESDKSVGEVLNIGSNYEISIGDTVKLISEIMTQDVTTEEESTRLRPKASEVERLWADNTKAKQLTNWEPRYSGKEGFRQGLEKTIVWFTDPNCLEKYKVGICNL